MRFVIDFRFNGDGLALAVTGVDGEISDVLLPSVGDVVEHRDDGGRPFRGRVTERVFNYDLEHGHSVGGTIAVTIYLDRMVIH